MGFGGIFLLVIVGTVGIALPSLLFSRERTLSARGEDRFSTRVRILGRPSESKLAPLPVSSEKSLQALREEYQLLSEFWKDTLGRRQKRIWAQRVVLVLCLGAEGTLGFFVFRSWVSAWWLVLPLFVTLSTLLLGVFWARRARVFDAVMAGELERIKRLFNRENASLSARRVREIKPAGAPVRAITARRPRSKPSVRAGFFHR